ncbi:MAG TPA: trigger factor [Lachnospiraceae bacterium]|nr:trigger factor [Lachnospiraceae bacterium]
MSIQVEKLEKNMAKLTIEASAEELDKALEKAYQKNKGKMSVPGFRKGKVPKAMIEKMYGKEVFYEDAANELIPEAYAKALDECSEEIVSQPTIDVIQLEVGKPFIFTAEVALKPEISLGKYKGVKVAKTEIIVSEEEIDGEIEKERENNARTISVEDRAVKDGDTTVIDFNGFVNGKEFDGGKGENYTLVIGSHSFIDTFEEQLIGKNIGDNLEVNVNFPEDYQAEELAGKPAMFKVAIKEIKEKELPELNDEFASEVSEFDTLAEYKEDVKKKLADKKETDAKNTKEDAVISAIIADAKMDIPDAMILSQQKQLVEDFAQRISSQGLTMEQYFQFTGLNFDTMLEQVKPQAEKRIKSRLVLEAVVAAEKMEASEEDYEAEVVRMSSMYQMEVDKIKEMLGESEKKQIMLDLAIEKAVQFVVAEAKEGK